MKTLAICTTAGGVSELGYEKKSLYNEAIKYYQKVFLIDPRRVTYKLVRGERMPGLVFGNEDLRGLDTLIVGGTRNYESSIGFLARCLLECGCDIFDPFEKFSIGKPFKLFPSLTRFQQGVGTDTFFAFDLECALDLMSELVVKDYFPILVKPVSGSQGKGIRVLESFSEAVDYAKDFFQNRDGDVPIMIQPFVDFMSEFRVLIVDKLVLGVVEKVKRKDNVLANAAQGATFVKVDNSRVMDFASCHVDSCGILGVDVAETRAGELHILEVNRAPHWKAFEIATGINVAAVIIDRAVARLNARTGQLTIVTPGINSGAD